MRRAHSPHFFESAASTAAAWAGVLATTVWSPAFSLAATSGAFSASTNAWRKRATMASGTPLGAYITSEQSAA